MAQPFDPYAALGVARACEQEVIDAAYRALMKKYHPDRYSGDKAVAERRCHELNHAYALLRAGAGRFEPRPALAADDPGPAGEAAAMPLPRRGWTRAAWPLVAGFGGLLALAAAYNLDTAAPSAPAERGARPRLAVDAGLRTPSLDALSVQERQSIELACFKDKLHGPAPYNRCRNAHADALGGRSNRPDLGGLAADERQSAELACLEDKQLGPQRYNACLRTALHAFGRPG